MSTPRPHRIRIAIVCVDGSSNEGVKLAEKRGALREWVGHDEMVMIRLDNGVVELDVHRLLTKYEPERVRTDLRNHWVGP